MPVYDTDIVSSFRAGDASVIARLLATPKEERFCSAVTVFEIMRGILESVHREHEKSLKGKPNGIVLGYRDILRALDFFSAFTLLPYDEQAEAIFQAFPAEVKRGKANDCRIAAVAMVHDLPIATRNLRDFGKIPGATVESWQ